MPVTRKQQLLVKLESSEAINANPGASNAVLIYEPKLTPEVEITKRVPAGSSMSRAPSAVGRKKRSVSFKSDFRGSGDITTPIDVPEWGTLGQPCGLRAITPIKIPVSGLTGTLGFQLGEIVQKSSVIRGVVVGLFSGTTLVHRLTGSGTVVVAPIQGTFTSSGTLTGESSECTATIGTVAAYDGLVYAPTSDKTINVTTGAWSAAVPAAGDTAIVKTAGVTVGLAQIVVDNSAGAFTNIDVVLLQGTISNGDTLTVGANTATISAAPTMARTPSATLRHNLDGRRRDIVGGRGSFELAGDASQPLVFTWQFEGDPATAVDALPVATSGLSTIVAPRFVNCPVVFGRVSAVTGDAALDCVRLPTKSLSLKSGNTLSPNLDANAAGGTQGTLVTDRSPMLNVVVNEVQGGFDWDSILESAAPVRFATLLGTTPGNIVGLVIPNAQVMEAGIGDSEGIVTRELGLEPQRVLESGDDEYFLVQL